VTTDTTQNTTMTTYRIPVYGMACTGCEAILQEQLRTITGVDYVDAVRDADAVYVVGDPATERSARAIVEQLGFRLRKRRPPTRRAETNGTSWTTGAPDRGVDPDAVGGGPSRDPATGPGVEDPGESDGPTPKLLDRRRGQSSDPAPDDRDGPGSGHGPASEASDRGSDPTDDGGV
jgi:copper chaperone CopZ